MTRRLAAAFLAIACAAATLVGTHATASAAPADGFGIVFVDGFTAPAELAGYDNTSGGSHSVTVSGFDAARRYKSGLISVPAADGFRVGAWNVDVSGANTTPRTVPECPGEVIAQRLEILQFEAVGADVQRFAARWATRCPSGIFFGAVAWHATVPVDVLTFDRLEWQNVSARIGTTGSTTVEITNRGTSTLHPSLGFAAPGHPTLSVEAGTCPAALAPGASCHFRIVFSPTDTSTFDARPLVASEASTWWDPAGRTFVQVITFTGRPAPPPGDALTPIDPVRLLDTRFGNGAPVGALAQTPLRVQIAGRGGVPTDATAVVANLTVTETTGEGFLTVWPSGEARPLVSNLNFRPGDTVPNSSVLALGADGALEVFNSSGLSHVIIDVVAWLSPFGDLVYDPFFAPFRVADTRDIGNQHAGVLGPGEERTLNVALSNGRAGDAVVLNITGTDPTAATHLTVYGKNRFTPLPNASTLNLRPGETRANLAIVNLADLRQITIYNNSGRTHVVVDVLGVLVAAEDTTTAGRIVPLTPFRATDTRAADEVFEPNEAGGYRFPTESGIGTLTVRAIVFNATVTEPTRPGFLTLFPWTDQAIPFVSTLNFAAGQTIPNAAWARLPRSPDNLVGVYNGSSGRTHVVLDIQAIVLD